MKLTKIMIIIFIMSSIILMTSNNHPLKLGMLVIFQCICMASLIVFTSKNSWFSLLIFMIYLGGILMLFCYMISLISSQKMKKIKSKKSLMMLMLFMTTIFNEEENSMKMTKMKLEQHIQSMFSKSMMISMFLMTFLLFIMIFVIFITENPKTSMRMMK